MPLIDPNILQLFSNIAKSIMAANTTIQIPDDVTVCTASIDGNDPKTLDRSNSSVYKEGLMTLPYQWVLYVGLKDSDNQPNSNLGGLAAGLPVYTQADNGSLIKWEYQTPAPSVVSPIIYFFPHSTATVNGISAVPLQYTAIAAEVAGLAGLPTAPPATAQVSGSPSTFLSSTTSSTSSSSTSPSNTALNGTASIGTTATTDLAAIASGQGIKTLHDPHYAEVE
jgi:hypothetical protein